MKLKYPNVEKVERVAHALGTLCEQLVFVGGCAVDLLLTDRAAAPTRVTYDVDLVAQVAALAARQFGCRFDAHRDSCLGLCKPMVSIGGENGAKDGVA